MPESHVATKQDIIATVPNSLDRLRVRIDFIAEALRYRLWQAENCLDAGYAPLSEQSRAEVYAQRASKVLLAKNADCPAGLQDIIDHRGMVIPELTAEAAI